MLLSGTAPESVSLRRRGWPPCAWIVAPPRGQRHRAPAQGRGVPSATRPASPGGLDGIRSARNLRGGSIAAGSPGLSGRSDRSTACACRSPISGNTQTRWADERTVLADLALAGGYASGLVQRKAPIARLLPGGENITLPVTIDVVEDHGRAGDESIVEPGKRRRAAGAMAWVEGRRTVDDQQVDLGRYPALPCRSYQGGSPRSGA